LETQKKRASNTETTRDGRTNYPGRVHIFGLPVIIPLLYLHVTFKARVMIGNAHAVLFLYVEMIIALTLFNNLSVAVSAPDAVIKLGSLGPVPCLTFSLRNGKLCPKGISVSAEAIFLVKSSADIAEDAAVGTRLHH
jgi:hypothetical protein